jgi:glyoxylase-like metal-dependent hydrolase (beta-lactamase superfamily II)
VISPYTCLYINTGRNRLLVDTGAGFAPTNGKLIENLAALDIAAADIDTIILTHGHADHIGATTVDNATDQPNLASMPADEHIKHLLVEFAHTKLPPIRGHIDLLDRETEIVPGIYAIPAPGHTPGHMALSISSGDQQVLHIADTVLHPILMEHPDWYPSFDLVPEQSLVTKRRLLDRAATDKALVLASHFPFPSLGYVVQKGTAWQWQPVEREATA